MVCEVPDDYVYLDWAATAPLSTAAAQAMAPYFVPGNASYGFNMNANSLHRPGRAAFSHLEEARRSLAKNLKATRPSEIIFTSGATEADNMALFGIAEGALAKHPLRNTEGFKPRIITTELEHDAILSPANALARQGFEVIKLRPDHQGFISLEDLKEALNDQTILVTIQMANSEIGSIQPIAKFSDHVHSYGAYFHTDATQALGKIPIDLQKLGVDSASFSAHKIGGPKGVGALYLKARTPFVAQMLGGGQEDGRRSTTQNVAGAVGFAAACEDSLDALEEKIAFQQEMRDELYCSFCNIEGINPTVVVPQGSHDFLPNIVHGLATDLESETMILRLDAKGFGVSGGSACSSHSLDPSHVLRSIGVEGDSAFGALRVSFGSTTTKTDIENFVHALTECLA